MKGIIFINNVKDNENVPENSEAKQNYQFIRKTYYFHEECKEKRKFPRKVL